MGELNSVDMSVMMGIRLSFEGQESGLFHSSSDALRTNYFCCWAKEMTKIYLIGKAVVRQMGVNH